MEFLRTCVSDSEDDTMLKTTRILMKTKTTTDTMMPVMVANVISENLSLHFIVFSMLTFKS